MQRLTLDKLAIKVIGCLAKAEISYLLIGGLATGVIGEARITEDVDVLIFIEQKKLHFVLATFERAGFKFDKKAVTDDARLKGAFKMRYDIFHIDFIFASTKFEESAFKRRLKVELFGKEVNIPSPEDFILFKLIPGRDKDLLDIKGVIVRHKDRLDLKYLENWAQRISDEAEDMRIWNDLQGVLKSA